MRGMLAKGFRGAIDDGTFPIENKQERNGYYAVPLLRVDWSPAPGKAGSKAPLTLGEGSKSYAAGSALVR